MAADEHAPACCQVDGSTYKYLASVKRQRAAITLEAAQCVDYGQFEGYLSAEIRQESF